MGVGTLATQAKGVGLFAIIVSIVLAILQGFTASTYNAATNTSSSVLSGTANTTITNAITGIGQYGSWFSIIVIAGIGFYLISYMSKAK